ncbi:sigma-70 family RNA polymerase sigma factor [Pedobacter frigidisoli]|uniref:Sigma-70 family RNA polymerase sigma factor n=1 Tax=Pedobacter frigidisoli TaxID=2530455 RepID=A0A4R0P4G3_9SPHI|nr:sigma-70 family RNA polymerase sigma factor [Pedobacter frigidisoli]TCD10184.1 sigma-70 family RNA polymerase sigma factor [Pedobacter frigidisoli]
MFKAVLNVPPAEPKDIRWFYDKYAAMLLGYINGIVKDHQKAEDHLVVILMAFANEFNGEVKDKNYQSTWLQLRQFAQNKLAFASVNSDQPIQKDDQLNLLNDLQKHIFCAIYYQGKSISYLANVLEKEEDEVRNQLKLSIDKMRRARGN